jgi:hypothetical protein
MDANAAGASCLRRFYPEALPVILASDDPSPARPCDPPRDPITLQRHVVAFIQERVKMLQTPLEIPTPYRSLADWLEALSPGAAAIWQELILAAA